MYTNGEGSRRLSENCESGFDKDRFILREEEIWVQKAVMQLMVKCVYNLEKYGIALLISNFVTSKVNAILVFPYLDGAILTTSRHTASVRTPIKSVYLISMAR